MTNGFFLSKTPGRLASTAGFPLPAKHFALSNLGPSRWQLLGCGEDRGLDGPHKKKQPISRWKTMNGWIAFIAFKMLDPEGIWKPRHLKWSNVRQMIHQQIFWIWHGGTLETSVPSRPNAKNAEHPNVSHLRAGSGEFQNVPRNPQENAQESGRHQERKCKF